MKPDEIEEDFVFLFSPLTSNDFWETKLLFDKKGISYKVKGKFYYDNKLYGEFNLKNQSMFYVEKSNFERAYMLNKKMIEKSKKHFDVKINNVSFFEKILKKLKLI